MFTISNSEGLDIKVWAERSKDLDQNTLDEAFNVANLPYAKSHMALMADGHATGFKMPVGGVLATKDVVVPEAISNDIGCGVALLQTDIPTYVLDVETPSGNVAKELVGSILRDLPTGFEHSTQEKNGGDMELLNLINDLNYGGAVEDIPKLIESVEESLEIIGSLGGGNHFVEFQQNKDGLLAIMIHTGSRSVGAKINSHFTKLAKELNDKWYVSAISNKVTMPFLPLESEAGQDYLKFMNFALDIAHLNRKRIMELVEKKLKQVLEKRAPNVLDYKVLRFTNVHHNYGAYEHIDGENYFVHRKGAVRAREGDIIPIPGAMGSSSYLAYGLGNEESFKSCSHGAGRTHTRTAAREEFSVQEVMEDLKDKGVVLGKANKQDVAEEYYKSYKDIDEVMEQQSDLVDIIDRYKTKAVIKG